MYCMLSYSFFQWQGQGFWNGGQEEADVPCPVGRGLRSPCPVGWGLEKGYAPTSDHHIHFSTFWIKMAHLMQFIFAVRCICNVWV